MVWRWEGLETSWSGQGWSTGGVVYFANSLGGANLSDIWRGRWFINRRPVVVRIDQTLFKYINGIINMREMIPRLPTILQMINGEEFWIRDVQLRCNELQLICPSFTHFCRPTVRSRVRKLRDLQRNYKRMAHPTMMRWRKFSRYRHHQMEGKFYPYGVFLGGFVL